MAFSRSRHATTFSAMAKRECVDGTDWGFCLPVSHCHPCCLELLELELSNRVTVFAVLGTNVPWKAMSLELPAVNVLVQQAKSVVGCKTAARTVNVKHSPLHGFFVVPSLDWRSSRMTNNSLKPGVLHVLFFFFYCELCRARISDMHLSCCSQRTWTADRRNSWSFSRFRQANRKPESFWFVHYQKLSEPAPSV